MFEIRKELDRGFITQLTDEMVGVTRLLEFMATYGDNVSTYDFHIFRVEDEFYIYHIDTGLCLSWYKHFGRSASFTAFTTRKDLIEFLEALDEDIAQY